MKTLNSVHPYPQFLWSDGIVSALFTSTTVTTIRSNIQSAATAIGVDVQFTYVSLGLYPSWPSVSAFRDVDHLAAWLQKNRVSGSAGIGSTPVEDVPFYTARLYWGVPGFTSDRYGLSLLDISSHRLEQALIRSCLG